MGEPGGASRPMRPCDVCAGRGSDGIGPCGACKGHGSVMHPTGEPLPGPWRRPGRGLEVARHPEGLARRLGGADDGAPQTQLDAFDPAAEEARREEGGGTPAA